MEELLKIRRQLHFMNKRKIALRAGLHENTLYRITTGQVTPNLDTLEKIKEAINSLESE